MTCKDTIQDMTMKCNNENTKNTMSILIYKLLHILIHILKLIFILILIHKPLHKIRHTPYFWQCVATIQCNDNMKIRNKERLDEYQS